MASQSGNRADSNLIAANIKSGISIFGVTGTYAPVVSGLPNNAISMLCTLMGYNGPDDSTPLRVGRVGFIEKTSYVYAAFALFSCNNADDALYYRLAVQKIDKATQAVTNTYLSNSIVYSASIGLAAGDIFLRSDTDSFYASFLSGGTYRWIEFDTATDTFSTQTSSGSPQELGIFNIAANTSTGNTTFVTDTLQLYTSAESNASNPGSDAPTTLVVSGHTYGVTYYYASTFRNGTDDLDSVGVTAFVTYV